MANKSGKKVFFFGFKSFSHIFNSRGQAITVWFPFGLKRNNGREAKQKKQEKS